MRKKAIMNTVEKILVKARELLSIPERWTQGSTAKNVKGESVLAYDETATSWCIIGACIKVAESPNEAKIVISALQRAMFRGLGYFNDTASHDKVLRLFDKAIKIAKKERDVI